MSDHDDHDALPPADPRIADAARSGCAEVAAADDQALDARRHRGAVHVRLPARLRKGRHRSGGASLHRRAPRRHGRNWHAGAEARSRLRVGTPAAGAALCAKHCRWARTLRFIPACRGCMACSMSARRPLCRQPASRSRTAHTSNARTISRTGCQSTRQTQLAGSTAPWIAACRRPDPRRAWHRDRRSAAHSARARTGARLVSTWFEKATAGNLERLEAVYTAIDPSLWNSLSLGIAADRLALASGAGNDGDISVLRKGFIGAARLMRADGGPRIAVLSVGGWDTHTQQGGLNGQFNDRLRELDQALEDLKSELGPAWAKTVTVCVTEFGRTVNTNGDGGTDHGIGTVAVLAGGAVKAGFVGDWPGLAPQNLLDGDLRPPSICVGCSRESCAIILPFRPRFLTRPCFPRAPARRPLAGWCAHRRRPPWQQRGSRGWQPRQRCRPSHFIGRNMGCRSQGPACPTSVSFSHLPTRVPLSCTNDIMTGC